MLIDTHAHLFWDSYKEDIHDVIIRAKQAGIGGAINVGVDVDISENATIQATELTQPDFKVYSSVAIHPEEAIRYINNEAQLEEDLNRLEKIYTENKTKVIGVGECGLDFAYFAREGYLPKGITVQQAKDIQRKLFKSQIALAKKLDLPLLIHCRDDRSKNFQNTECWDEVVELTKNHFGIYHCYSSLLPTTESIITDTSFLFSFAGNLTYPKNDYLKEAVRIIPLERIVLETDCPFLPPQSIRGKRNEPSSVAEIAKTIADLKGVTAKEVEDATTENFTRLFKLESAF
jgi:TatD DNase family protein